MNLLFLDCGMGAAGDMLTAALLELFPDPDAVLAELNGLGVPGVCYAREITQKCGITGTHMHVYVGDTEEDEHMHGHHHHDHHHDHEHAHDHHHDHEHSHHDHHHSGMEEILHWISHIHTSEAVKDRIRSVYETIARAESKVHNTPMEHIHFHEVGSLDALADVTAVCYLMDKLGNPVVHATPVHVGSGRVSCAHGILPVPAPATAEILKGVPIYGGSVTGELCTPTGAALLKQFVSSFDGMPVMTMEAVGYGMGKKDFAIANCVRAVLGSSGKKSEEVAELSCNLDDMTGEDIGYAMEKLLDAGALDVFTQPIGMKKNRPGVLLTVLCRPEEKQRFAELLFCHTTTLGIRESILGRYTLERSFRDTEVSGETVRIKTASGYGARRSKPEYEDLVKIAEKRNLPLSEVRELLK